MRVDQIILAEGTANDLRGSLTLVGVSQRIFVHPVLPFRLLLRAAIILTDEIENGEGRSFEEIGEAAISLSLVDPDGNTTRIWRQPVELPSQKDWIDLPLQAIVVADIAVEGKTYGIYLIRVSFTASNHHEQVRTIPLYVIQPPSEIVPRVPRRAFPLDAAADDTVDEGLRAAQSD